MMRRAFALVLVAACGDNIDGSLAFRKHVIDPDFRSEGVAVFDVDHDGHLDFVTAELWHAGPTFKVAHELRPAREFDPTMGYAHSFLALHQDVDGDGFEDLVDAGGPGGHLEWCRNPVGQDEHWACYPVVPANVGESPQYADLFGTGSPVLISGVAADGVLGVLTPGEVGAQWTVQALSPPAFTPASQHGLGVVDINADGRRDVVTGSGWLEHPELPETSPWPWHPVDLCVNDCAHITGFDITGDGRMDLIGTSPHRYGAWWWEQTADGQFERHVIDETLSQNHSAQLVDLDRDDVPELITGKRWLAHLAGDPGTDDPVLLVIYKLDRATREWTRLQIDDDSGVGLNFEVIDVDRDGRRDIVIASKKGLFWFEQR